VRTFFNVIQTISISLIFVFVLKIISFLRKLWLKVAIRNRVNYNRKHGLPLERGLGEIDASSLSYQTDSIEGNIATIILFLIGLLFTLFIPIQKDILFSIVAATLSIIFFVCCLFVHNLGTNKYQILIWVFIGVSLILIVHIVFSLVLDTIVLIEYNNSINALLYIWNTLLIYKLLLDSKR